MNAIILAAGKGTRLGLELPKCLTPIIEGQSILDLQLSHLRRCVDHVTVVVGHQAELIMEGYPHCAFVSNPDYHSTNTAVSLSIGLDHVGAGDVIWVNGDVVFVPEVLDRLIMYQQSALATKRCNTGDEEVKFRAAADGRITAVSKGITDGLGEAVGVNIVRAADRPILQGALRRCGRKDYFERGVEMSLTEGAAFYSTDVTDLPCMEIDFPEDLVAARTLFGKSIVGRQTARLSTHDVTS